MCLLHPFCCVQAPDEIRDMEHYVDKMDAMHMDLQEVTCDRTQFSRFLRFLRVLGVLGVFLGFSWQVVADLNMRLQAVFSLDEVVTGRFASGILQ